MSDHSPLITDKTSDIRHSTQHIGRCKNCIGHLQGIRQSTLNNRYDSTEDIRHSIQHILYIIIEWSSLCHEQSHAAHKDMMIRKFIKGYDNRTFVCRTQYIVHAKHSLQDMYTVYCSVLGIGHRACIGQDMYRTSMSYRRHLQEDAAMQLSLLVMLWPGLQPHCCKEDEKCGHLKCARTKIDVDSTHE